MVSWSRTDNLTIIDGQTLRSRFMLERYKNTKPEGRGGDITENTLIFVKSELSTKKSKI